MKATAKNINNYLKQIADSNICGILLYGPNQGLINDISKNITKHLGFEVKNIDFSLVNNNSLYNYINTQDLFASKLVIKINNTTATLHPMARQVLDSSILNFVIFIAEDLSPGSSLRDFFENSKNYLAVACYYQEAWEIKTIILNFIKDSGKTIAEDALAYLVTNLSGDYKVITNELEKLILYTEQNSVIQLEHIESSLIANTEFSIEEVCYYFANNDSKNFFSGLNKLANENIQPITVLRALGRLFGNLYIVSKAVNAGIMLDGALKAIKPPIFFKYLPKFKKIIERTSSNNCQQILDLVLNCESMYKTTGSYPKNLIEQLYIQKIALS